MLPSFLPGDLLFLLLLAHFQLAHRYVKIPRVLSLIHCADGPAKIQRNSEGDRAGVFEPGVNQHASLVGELLAGLDMGGIGHLVFLVLLLRAESEVRLVVPRDLERHSGLSHARKRPQRGSLLGRKTVLEVKFRYTKTPP